MRQKYIVNKESKSYLANLLATESLEVQYKKTATASFDVKNRILTLPIWKKSNQNGKKLVKDYLQVLKKISK